MPHLLKGLATSVLFVALLPAASIPASAQVKHCTDLRDEIAQKIRSRGSGAFQLHILERSEKTSLKIVGTCDGGTGKIAFQSGDGPAQVAERTAAPPAKAAAAPPVPPSSPPSVATAPAAPPKAVPTAPAPAAAVAPTPAATTPAPSATAPAPAATAPAAAASAPAASAPPAPPVVAAPKTPAAAAQPPVAAAPAPEAKAPAAMAETLAKADPAVKAEQPARPSASWTESTTKPAVAPAAPAAVDPRAAPAVAAATAAAAGAAATGSGASTAESRPGAAPELKADTRSDPKADPKADTKLASKAEPKVLGMVESKALGSAAAPLTAPEGLWASGETRQCHAAYPSGWQAEKLDGEQEGKATKAGQALSLPYRVDIHPSFEDPLALSHFHYVFGIRQPWRYELRPMAIARRDWAEAARLSTMPRAQLRSEEQELKDEGMLEDAVSKEEWDRARQLAKSPAVDIVWYELSSLAKVANQSSPAPKPVGEFTIRTMMKYPDTAGVEDQHVTVWDDGYDWVVGFSLNPNQVFGKKDKRSDRVVYEYRCWASKKLDREQFVQTCGSLIERSTRSPDFPLKSCVTGSDRGLAYAKGR